MVSRLTALFALLLAFLATPAFAAAHAGAVLAMGGQCFRAAGDQRTPLKVGDAVDVGDKLVVPADARLKLRMEDGSIIAAASGTTLTIAKFALGGAEKRDASFELGGGLLRAIVSAVGEPQSFEVKTATGVAAVRSTDWFIDAKADSTQVGVREGVVTLSSATTGKQVRIPARWGARVEAGLDPVPPRVWTEAEFAAVIARTDLP